MEINIVGGGLAGAEAAYAIAECGISVNLFEMKPEYSSEVHKSDKLAEIVCSNSFGSMKISTASGLLKKEMEILHSLTVRAAYETKVDAGGALAVDRNKFSDYVTECIQSNEHINLINEKIDRLDNENMWIVACGPLCDSVLVEYIKSLLDMNTLYFYDAIAPIVYADSVDFSKGFWGSRYSEDKDYFNCVFTQEDYKHFYNELIDAEKVEPREFEKNYFEACLPIEEIASRGHDTLLFGPMKPVGLRYNGKQPYAVVQLRKENSEGTILSLVGFQTKLTYAEQLRIFRMIPALNRVEFAKLGSVHRNTFIDSPKLLNQFLQLKNYRNIFFAGQITGAEGYMASAASGIYAGINAALRIKNKAMMSLDNRSMIGGLINYIISENAHFQPMSENFGLLKHIKMKNKAQRREKSAEIAVDYVKNWRKLYESAID